MCKTRQISELEVLDEGFVKSMTWENVSSFLKNVRSALRELLCFAQLEASEAQSVDVPVCRGVDASVRHSAGMQGCRVAE